MSTKSFLSPRLTGPRFDDHSIPLEFLKDFSVLEEMINEVAKGKYLEDNPTRKRSPRGFTKGIELSLSGIEEGSAIANITLFVATTNSLLTPENQDYFENARDSIVEAIAAAENGESITAHLPEKSLSYFDRMGRSLRDGEAIEFTTPKRKTPAKLTKEVRRNLVLTSSRVNELTEEISSRGFVPEVDQARKTFEIQIPGGRKLKAPIAEQHIETILKAFNGYKEGARVLVEGIGRLNRTSELLGYDSIEHISILDELDVPSRLDELRVLKNGWLEGRGKVPSPMGLDWLSSLFDDQFPDDLPLPYLYPTEEGGIQVEWSLRPVEVSVEIDVGTHLSHWHEFNLDADTDSSKELRLDKPGDWTWMLDRIRQLSGGAA